MRQWVNGTARLTSDRLFSMILTPALMTRKSCAGEV
jgi:hypothetical protein